MNMKIHITLVGLNHRCASVDLRERYSLADFHSPETWAIPCTDPIKESLIISTCNRVEILAAGQDPVSAHLLNHWARACNANVEELATLTYIHNDLEAVRHIFEVASSLDSMILGEPQILGQLKNAYRDAVAANGTGMILNRLMHHAFSTAKRVRHETAIASSAVSISYAAVELAKRIFGQMRGHSAMLIGAGEMAELAATHLLQAGIEKLAIANRTFSRGQQLAEKFHGIAIPFEALIENLADADIVIASTGSKVPILNKDNLQETLRSRKNRPMFLIDIAVPRDIDPDANNLDNIYLYDIDDLKDVVEENMTTRKGEAERGKKIIDEEILRFKRWLDNLGIQPTIVDLLRKGETAAQEELKKTLKRLGPVAPDTKAALEAMARSLVKKLNHDPIAFLKKTGLEKDDPHRRIEVVRRVFNLDRENDLKTHL